jgi:hypothetical protein
MTLLRWLMRQILDVIAQEILETLASLVEGVCATRAVADYEREHPISQLYPQVELAVLRPPTGKIKPLAELSLTVSTRLPA